MDVDVPLTSEESELDYGYAIDSVPLKQGAEARLVHCSFLGRPAIVKERFTKKYRHKDLDQQLTKSRMQAELRALVKCKQLGIDVPAVYFVDSHRSWIVMERVGGELTVRDYIERRRTIEPDSFALTLKSLAVDIGATIATLHAANIAHGDLTTSNMMLRDADPRKLVLIDFGLTFGGQITHEDKGVDLYVLEKALLSTHPNTEALFSAMLEGYRERAGLKSGQAVIKKLDEIRLRGRKRDMVG